jgi:hypothetical protein
MSSLTTSFLKTLIALMDNEITIGLTMEGSYARRTGGPLSDVDIRCFLPKIPAKGSESSYLRYLDGHLVSIALTTLDDEYSSLRNPEKAIWAIPGLRQQRILLDKDGSIAVLKEFAAKTTWEPLQAAANAYASWNLSGCAEEILKILSGLAKQDESKTLYAIWGLTRGLANSLLIQRGILVPTENVYIDLVQTTAGRSSTWTRQFRLAIGLDPLAREGPAYIGYAAASLRLYFETAALLQGILLPEDATVVNKALEMIAKAGY